MTISAPLGLVRPVGVSEKSQGGCSDWSLQGRGRGPSSRSPLATLEQQKRDSHMGLKGKAYVPKPPGPTSPHIAQLARLLHEGTEQQLRDRRSIPSPWPLSSIFLEPSGEGPRTT